MSECVKALAAALPRIANPDKNGKSHHGRFLTLPALLDHCKPILAEHGLAILQTIDADGVRTLFVHESGDVFDAGTYPVGHFANPQAQGSAVSFARRYALQAAVGVSGADDDGNAAAAASKAPVRRSEGSEARLVSAAQMKALMASLSHLDRDARLAFVVETIGRDITSSKELTAQEASKVLERVKGATGG